MLLLLLTDELGTPCQYLARLYPVLLLALTNGCYNYLFLSFARLPYGMLRYQHSPCLPMACWLSRTFVTFYQCRLLDACMNRKPHTHPSLASGERFMSVAAYVIGRSSCLPDHQLSHLLCGREPSASGLSSSFVVASAH